ncbi:MAG: hypothetical protein RLZZ127_1590 [Planctomycetota bacterium]|jgi:uncharacterized protein Yka (UPF0111/DUF47 family)
MPFQALLRVLLPRDERFYDILERQMDLGRQAAAALGRLREGGDAVAVRKDLQALEERSDKELRAMQDSLARTFATPIDREDLERISKRLDGIVAASAQAVRACVLFGVDRPTTPMQLLIGTLGRGIETLAGAVALLRQHDYAGIIAAGRAIESLEQDGDDVFREAVRALFHDERIDAKTILREKEVLEDLERALDRCRQTAELLTNVAVKHA